MQQCTAQPALKTEAKTSRGGHVTLGGHLLTRATWPLVHRISSVPCHRSRDTSNAGAPNAAPDLQVRVLNGLVGVRPLSNQSALRPYHSLRLLASRSREQVMRVSRTCRVQRPEGLAPGELVKVVRCQALGVGDDK